MHERITKPTILAALAAKGHEIYEEITTVQHIMRYDGLIYFLILLEKTQFGELEILRRNEHCVNQNHVRRAQGYCFPTIIIILEIEAQRVLAAGLANLELRPEKINGCLVQSFARSELEDITDYILGKTEDLPIVFGPQYYER